jgi:hypothetical protein
MERDTGQDLGWNAFPIEKLIYFDAIITLTHRKRSPLSLRERVL